MTPLEKNSFFDRKDKLNVTLISGVNGVGKTTSIGKIGKILKQNHNDVLFAACDTFRAAAIDQLVIWADRVGVDIVKQDMGSDPASVSYDTLQSSKSKKISLTEEIAMNFYNEHSSKPFYNELVEFITSGEVIVQVLQGENAIKSYRALMGSTNPEEAEEGTLRKLFAESLSKNAVHGSDSQESAMREIAIMEDIFR